MWVARLSGMRVDKFSIFFGPPIFRWRGKNTTYQIATLPLGGFVQIAGMNPQEQLPPDDTGSYQNKPVWKRFATIFAGPAINYLFAMVIMVVVLLGWGLPTWQTAVGAVSKDFPAAAAGMKPKDVIVAIDGKKVSSVPSVLAAIAKSEGKPLAVKVKRGAEAVDLSITPRAVGEGWKIGIQFARKAKFHKISAGKALLGAVYYPFAESAKQLAGIKKLITRKATGAVGGPLEIVRQIKLSFEQSFVAALLFMAMLNVVLGLFNLLPLPALDGGRLIFLVVEIITRRPVNQRVENWVHTAGFLLLAGVLLLVTYGDLKRLL